MKSLHLKADSPQLTVQSRKFKVQSSKFKVQSSKFKVQSSKFKVQSRSSLGGGFLAEFRKLLFAVFLLCLSLRYFFTSFRLLVCFHFPTFVLSNPGAAEDADAFVEHGALAGRDGALRCVERDAGARIGESFNQRGGGFVFVADFYLCADR